MYQLVLYTTSGCHLCEHAKELTKPLLARYKISLREVDIAESELLIEQYGIRIPVLSIVSQAEERALELAWPFDQQELVNFLDEGVGLLDA